jgi:SPP1 family predicted phage head-tail adaptor
MAIDSGQLNRRVTIQRPSTSQDEYGQPTDDWQEFITTWARISTITGKELYALGPGFTAQVTHNISIRWRSGVTSAMRINYRGRIFQVQSVSDPDENRVELDILCLEINEGTR